MSNRWLLYNVKSGLLTRPRWVGGRSAIMHIHQSDQLIIAKLRRDTEALRNRVNVQTHLIKWLRKEADKSNT